MDGKRVTKTGTVGAARLSSVMRQLPGRCLLPLLAIAIVAPAAVQALTNEDLRRYGFGTELTGAMNEAREVQPPRKLFNADAIPKPRLPNIAENRIPEAPLLKQRVFRQSGPIPSPGREGRTEDLKHPEAARIEGTFKEVQNFFFRPRERYLPILSVNAKGLTGLWNTNSAYIQKKGTTWFRAGVAYGYYDRSGGKRLAPDERIEKIYAPFTYMTVPIENLETSLQIRVSDENANNFPLPERKDWRKSDVEDVQVMGKYRFIDNRKENYAVAFGLGLRIGIENGFATRRGSSGVDYETFLAFTKGIKNFSLNLEGGFIFPNGEDSTNSGVADINYGNFGIEFRPNGKLNLGVEANYMDWRFGGHSMETTLGAKYRVSRDWVLDLSTTFENDDTMAVGRRYHTMASIQVKL